MNLLVLYIVLVSILAANALHINRSKDYHKIHRSKSVKQRALEGGEKEVHQIGGVGVGRVSLTRGESHRQRWRNKETLTEDFVRESFDDWINFKNRYNKSYESLDEERERFLIFGQNKRKIDNHNKEFHMGNKTFKLKVNHLADLRPEEYNYINGFKRNYGDSLAKNHGATYMMPHHTSVPDSVDWRLHNYVTPVKNQGHCGSCWSFSSTGSLEGQHKRKTGRLVSLSEQNLVDCSTPYGNHGCNGGLMDQAFQYIKQNGGVDTEQSYPYEAMDDRCRFKNTSVGADDKGFVDVPSGNERMLQNAVATVGPVSVAIDASHQSFQFYNGGVYFEPQCSPENLDHGVLVVGYGITDEGVEYWIVKNSWGPGWGEEGYIKMARNRDNMCGIATSASYPLV